MSTVISETQRVVKDYSREVVPVSELLKRLLKLVVPVHFQLIAFPECTSIITEMEALNPSANEDHIKHYQRLQDKLSKKKVTRSMYLIIAIDIIKELVDSNDWGLAKKDGQIYIYNSTHWEVVSKDEFSAFLGNACVAMGINPFKCRDHLFRKDLLLQFMSEAYVSVDQPDNDTTLINLANGTFHVSSTGKSELKPFKKEDWLTYILPFSYDPEAKAPLFDKYLKDVLPDKQKQSALSEFIASCFVRCSVLKLEKMLVLIGSGSNGKSLAMDVVNALLGSENTSNYGLKDLCDDSKYTRAKLSSVLLNQSSELSSKIDAQNFKLLASTEPIQARLPYSEPWVMKDYAKLACNTNILPKDVEQSTGYYRRWLILEFNQTIKEENQDRDLVNKIIGSELPAIFNWVLAGLDRLLEQRGFSKCVAAEKALERYRDNSDSVRLFVKDMNYSASDSEMIDLKRLYSHYQEYCRQDGCQPVANRNFRARLKAIGINAKRFDTGWRVYIKKKSTKPEIDDDGF